MATTKTRNAGPVDFSLALERDDIVTERRAARSTWAKKIDELVVGVYDGDGEWDHFYRLGEFANASGATTAKRDIIRNGHLPEDVELETRTVTHDDGRRTSELWGAVVTMDEVA